MISVAMSTYNGKEFVVEQLNSIVNQTLLPDEIVVIDDCSTDDTFYIVKEFSKNHNEILWNIKQNEENVGYIVNFFNVINICKGDIIILCDQDDIWEKNKVSVIYNLFERYPDMLSLHMDYKLIDKNQISISEREIGYKEDTYKYSIADFCKRLNYCGMSSAFRSTLKTNLNELNPVTLPTHDWVIHAIAAVKNGLYVSGEIVSLRRYHETNVALNIDKKVQRSGIEQRVNVVQNYLEYYQLVKRFNEKFGYINNKDYIEKLIYTEELRINNLQKKNVMGWIGSVFDLKYYPSLKAFWCDLLYIIGVF